MGGTDASSGSNYSGMPAVVAIIAEKMIHVTSIGAAPPLTPDNHAAAPPLMPPPP